MNAQEYFNVVVSLIGLSALGFILWVLYPKYAMDKFRQEMFAIRDEMFRDADAGRISFDSDAYRLFRTLINSHIRFTHRLGLVETIGVVIYIRVKSVDLGVTFSDKLDSAMGDLAPDQRAIFAMYYSKIMQQVFRKLVLGSAFVMLIFPAIVGALMVQYWIESLLKFFKGPIGKVNGAVVAELEAEMASLSAA